MAEFIEDKILGEIQKQLEEPQQDTKEPEPEAGKETKLQGQPSEDNAYLQKLEELKQVILAQKQAQPKEEPKQEPADKELERLMRMTPQERAEWAVKHGDAGVLKLMELQDRLYQKKFEQVLAEAKTATHDTIVDEWAAANKDLFEDEELAAIADGIEKQMLRKLGVSSYKEVPASVLKQNLEQVAKRTREIGIKLGKIQAEGKEPEKKDNELETALGAFRSVGDVSGGAVQGGSDIVDITNVSGFDLESLPLDKLEQLEAKLLQ